MKRRIITTSDGSKTIQIPEWNEQYHSIHGAVAEARHVFIAKALLHYLDTNPNTEQISILEMGFGSGLNAILTFLKSHETNTNISYTGIEAFPLSDSELKELDYITFLNLDNKTIAGIYDAPWNKEEFINQNFLLHKIQSTFQEVLFSSEFNIIYFDAFGPRVQPELWTEDIFIKMFQALKPGGIMTTYCSKGDVRRTMIKVGFNVEKIPGPPGKREMLRAIKPC